MESGVAGSSARREYTRRQQMHEARVKQRFGRASGLILAVTSEPQSVRAWEIGAAGEEVVAKALARVSGFEVRLLHDRRIPGSRANIDHLVVTTAGVTVVDSKRYRGKIEVGRSTLRIAGRNQTKLVDSLERQCEIVRRFVVDVPVTGALCFVEADFALVRRKQTLGISVTSPRGLLRMIRQKQASSTSPYLEVDGLARRISDMFVPA